jgi:hypothetical protein
MATGNVGSTGLLDDPILKLNTSNLIEDDHSHPGGIHYPSGRNPEGINVNRNGDVQVAKGLEQQNPNIKFNIYTPSDKAYTPYSGSSAAPDEQPVIVTPHKKKKVDDE